MIRLEVPGWGTSELGHLILDLNGTVALDGELFAGVDRQLALLSADLVIHIEDALDLLLHPRHLVATLRR